MAAKKIKLAVPAAASLSLATFKTEVSTSSMDAYWDMLVEDAAANQFILREMPWLVLDGSDPGAREKGWFALTLGRASFRHQPLADEKEICEKFGLAPSQVAPGYYLLAPDGSIASAYIVGLEGDGKHWRAFETQTLPALRALGAMSDETFISKITVNPKKLLSRANQFSDAMEVDFGSQALEDHGVDVQTRRLDERKMAGGYAAAWMASDASVGNYVKQPGTQKIDPSQGMEIAVAFGDLLGAPYNNHAANSLVKNLRDFCPVNNKDLGKGADQIKAREAIVSTLAQHWLSSVKATKGLMDEKSGIDPECYEDARLAQIREQVANSFRNPLGNEKKLAIKPSDTVIRLGAQKPDGKANVLFVSRDMAFIDGQHSSRNYALVASAFGGGEVYYDEPGEGLVKVDGCSMKVFRAIFDKAMRQDDLLVAKGGKAKWTALGFKDQDAAFGAFVDFAQKQAKATIKTVPVSTAAQAMELTRIANQATPPSRASQAEHVAKSTVKAVVDSFNDMARSLGNPLRLAMSKGASGDPKFATDVKLTRTFQEIFPSLWAGCMRVQNSGAAIGPHHRRHAKATLERCGIEASDDNLLKFSALLQMSGKIKTRNFMLSAGSVKRFSTAIGGIQAQGRGAEKSAGAPAFEKITMEHIFDFKLLGLEKMSGYEGSTPQQKIYALVSAAIVFQGELDKQWARISGQELVGSESSAGKAKRAAESKALAGCFDTKATFENWMVLGTLQQHAGIGSQAAFEGIGQAVDNLIALSTSKLMDGKFAVTHNEARESLVLSEKVSKDRPFAQWDFESGGSNERLLLLLSAMPGAGEAPVASFTDKDLIEIKEMRNRMAESPSLESATDSGLVGDPATSLEGIGAKMAGKRASKQQAQGAAGVENGRRKMITK